MKEHIPSLNGLRTISILMVIGSHLQINFHENIALRYLGSIFFNGSLGVNIFFVISGFLITTLLKTELEKYGSISYKKFYIRRALRIFPAYYFLLLVYFILQANHLLKLTDWLSDLTYMKQFFGDGNPQTAHLWSLSVEEIFYLIWPFLFIKTKGNTSMIKILILLIVASRFIQYLYPSLMSLNVIYSRGDALLIGCLFAIKNTEVLFWLKKYKAWIWLMIPVILLCALSGKYFYHTINVTHANHNLWINILGGCVYSLFGEIGLLPNLLIGAILIFTINFKNIWINLLNLRVMEYIGKLSYSIYLWQQLCIFNSSFNHSLIQILVLIASASLFSYYIIEKPFLRLKKGFAMVKNHQ